MLSKQQLRKGNLARLEFPECSTAHELKVCLLGQSPTPDACIDLVQSKLAKLGYGSFRWGRPEVTEGVAMRGSRRVMWWQLRGSCDTRNGFDSREPTEVLSQALKPYKGWFCEFSVDTFHRELYRSWTGMEYMRTGIEFTLVWPKFI